MKRKRAALAGMWVAISMLALLGFARADDRFPPYDNTDEVTAFWKSKPDFFQWKTLNDLPKDLVWEHGGDPPEFGDPAAKKGGIFHTDIDSFPPTYRSLGPDATNPFRSEQYDNINVDLVMRHLNVDAWVPGLADEWAFSPDKKTVYYHLNPKATYSDGSPIAVEDYFMAFYVMLSPYIKDPWYNDFYSKEFQAIVKYDEHTMSITIPERKPDPLWYAMIQPMQRKFFREFGPDFPARYQWRKAPTTGAYEFDATTEVKRGRSITLHRVKDWWAKDHKNYRYRFNPDFIEYRVIASQDKAFEMFRQGQLDYYYAGAPRYWYDKSEIPEIYNGYIEKQIFYNDYPRITRCICTNESKPPMDNLEVRLGISYALNIQKVIDVDLRGDSTRMQSVFAGFGKYTDPGLHALPYDVGKAQEHFAKAGYTKRGADGVLMDEKGQRLSFTFSIPGIQMYVQLALRLKEDAIKAGLELKIEALDTTQLFKKLDQKNHELSYTGTAATPPYPRFWEFFASENAWKVMPDGTRKKVPDTNNFTMTADPKLDVLIDQQRKAETEDEVQRLSWKLEKLIEDRACVVPLWEAPFYRYESWRWVGWPKDGNVKTSQLPLEGYVFWLDDNVKEETKKAMRQGHSYGEVTHVYDQYRKQ